MRACGDAARPWPSPDRAPARDDTHTHTVGKRLHAGHGRSEFELAGWSVRHPEAEKIPPGAGFKSVWQRGGGAWSNSGTDTHGGQIHGGCLRAAIARRACVQARGVRGCVGSRGVGDQP